MKSQFHLKATAVAYGSQRVKLTSVAACYCRLWPAKQAAFLYIQCTSAPTGWFHSFSQLACRSQKQLGSLGRKLCRVAIYLGPRLPLSDYMYMYVDVAIDVWDTAEPVGEDCGYASCLSTTVAWAWC